MDNKRVVLKPSHIAERERRAKRRRVYFFVATILVLLGILSFASHLRSINISNVIVEGNRISSVRDITKSANKTIEGNYFFIFSKSNIFIFSKSSIEKDLLNEYPRLESVSVSRLGFNGIKIVVKEREGQYLWCGYLNEEFNINSESACYFTDEEGYIFGTSPYFSGDAYFKFYGSETINRTLSPIGQNVTDKARFIELIRLVYGLEGLDIVPESIKIQDNGEYRIVLTKTDNNQTNKSFILFSRENNLEESLDNLAIALSSVDFKKQFDEERSNLLYIDLRFKDKVYYKFMPKTANF
ncbi:FtsQ-type POTRA domain-containing protein [Candidatus Nomurabacteria bacterium]|nr:MAG: FtsQ-type POTRA domain-containing protein [Candidatus Nomurabacteria bacterium]